MKRLIFAVIFLVSVPFAWADSASDLLANKLNKVVTFASDFKQKVLDEKGNVLQQSAGEMQFNRPLLFYWHISSSNPQTIWYRKSELIVYDERLRQATLKKVYSKNDPNLLPLMLLTGNATEVLKHFTVTVKQDAFVLNPVEKDKNELLVGVMLQLADDGSVKEIQYQTTLDQRTQINFFHTQVNKPLNQKLFFQILPTDTDVVNVE
jgi:chaperone LolA